MKVFLNLFLFASFLFSCSKTSGDSNTKFRQDFTEYEKKVMDSARKIIDDCYYGTLITVDKTGQPKARVMEPFAPEDDFVIWLATNPRSRKTKELQNNPKATMHYFSKRLMAYVSLMGEATLVNDRAMKQKYWKPGWEKFYSNKDKDYMLIKFVPRVLELINIPEGLTGDKETWKPEQVTLRK